MTPAQLMEEALAQETGEREAFLMRACGGGPEGAALRAEVADLLEKLRRANEVDFLPPEAVAEGELRTVRPDDQPPVEANLAGAAPDADEGGDGREHLGPAVGPYVVEEQIGSGGFGTVYRASRGDGQFRQVVAIKVLKRGLDTDQILRRFRNERQTLADLGKHPHIVTLLDGGVTADGRPYFVMEYVDGLPLDRYCDEHRLPVRERVRLILLVCAAVQHAHKSLVVHRDLKPANVLAFADGAGGHAVRLLDFGIAKVLSPNGSGAEPESTGPAERVFTPAYASPEQVRGQRVDVTSDVYSLGVLLYELLCGHRPYRFDGATPEEVVCGHEPVPPSAKVPRTETVSAADGVPVDATPEVVCARRACTPRQLRRQLAWELDNIALKALRKEQGARYQSVEELARDLTDYLEGNPVRARGNPFGYRAGKFVRKHKGKLGSAAAAVLMILGLAGWALVERGRAWDAAAHARDQWDRAEEARYAHAMNLVASEWEGGNVRRVLQLLSEYGPGSGREHLRDDAWYYFSRLCQGARRTLVGHGDSVRCLALFPGGTTLVSGGWAPLGPADETVKVWDVATGRLVGALPGFRESVESLTLSRDGKRLAVVSLRGRVTVWEGVPDTPRPLFTLEEKGVRCATVTADGRALVTGTDGGDVKLWDVATGRQSAVFRYEEPAPPTGNRVRAVALAGGGQTLATGHDDGAVRLWDMRTHRCLRVLSGHKQAVYALAFAPDGRTLASAGEDRAVRLWDPDSGEVRDRLRGHTALVRCLAFSPDGKTLASGSLDTTVRLWNTMTSEVDATLRGHLDPVTALAFLPDGKALATASADGTIKLWDLGRNPERLTFRRHGGGVHSVAFSPDGKTLTWGGARPEGRRSAGEVAAWDLRAGRGPSALREYPDSVKSLDYCRGGNTLAVGTGKAVHLLDPSGWRKRTVISQQGMILAVALAPGGRTLATAAWGEQSAVGLWDVATGRQVAVVDEPKDTARSLAFSPDGQTLAVGTSRGTVHLWDVATGRLRQVLRGHERVVHAVTFAPDGRTLASAGEDQTVRLWDAGTGGQLASLSGHRGAVRCAAFARDGRVLASGGDDGTVRLWHAAGRQELATLQARTGRVESLAFSPAGAGRLAAGCSDGTLIVWDMGAFPESQTAGEG
jgi:WD40 repeat protein/serine/threonine protein kinase